MDTPKGIQPAISEMIVSGAEYEYLMASSV
jgi:hypothetical protein